MPYKPFKSSSEEPFTFRKKVFIETRDELTNFLFNSVKITGCNWEEDLRVKRLLFETGKVGRDNILGLWVDVSGTGVNKNGLPTQLYEITGNYRSFNRVASYEPNAEGAYIIFANPTATPLIWKIETVSDIIADIMVGIKQNVRAVQQPRLIGCKDKDVRLSIQRAINDIESGETSIIMTDTLAQAFNDVLENKTPFIADSLFELKKKLKTELMIQLGIIGQYEKRERVQSSELLGSMTEAIDSINLTIDTFNAQMKQYGLPYSMIINNSIAEIYDAELSSLNSQGDNNNVGNNQLEHDN